MTYTRREFARMSLAALPAMAATTTAFSSTLPNGVQAAEGVNLGVITYSFRSMPDQSAEAMLRYVKQSGVNQVQLLDVMVENFAGSPQFPSLRPAGAAPRPTVQAPDPATLTGSWAGVPCAPARTAATRPTPAAGRSPRPMPVSPEHQALLDAGKKWRRSASLDRFKALRKLYNDAGVSIYSVFLLGLGANIVASEEDTVYAFDMAEALGATHVTIELPTDGAALKRIGDYAVRRKIYAAYHAHLQSSFTAWDEAFAVSKGNMSNIDVGHYVAAGAGDPLLFLKKHHARIASFHLKDRTTPQNCALNLPFGQGETPIAAILRMVRNERYTMPATIEMEYDIPAGSDAVKEVAKGVEYCKRMLI